MFSHGIRLVTTQAKAPPQVRQMVSLFLPNWSRFNSFKFHWDTMINCWIIMVLIKICFTIYLINSVKPKTKFLLNADYENCLIISFPILKILIVRKPFGVGTMVMCTLHHPWSLGFESKWVQKVVFFLLI